MNRKLLMLMVGILVLNVGFVFSKTTATHASLQQSCGLPDHGAAAPRTALPLAPNTSLVQGQKYPARTGNHYLLFQDDGNLVVNDADDRRIWGLNQVLTDFGQVGCIVLGSDGNLVASTATGDYLWSALNDVAKTDRAANLVVNSRGALQIVSPGRGVQWSSDDDLTSEFDLLQADVETCRTGTELLSSNMYTYPEDPNAASGNKRAFAEVYAEFKETHLQACNAVGAVISGYQSLPVLAKAEKAITDSGAADWNDLFNGDFGIVLQGDRVPEYCPDQHLTQFDCEKATERITNGIAGVQQTLDQLNAVECLPTLGWGYCQTIASPKITIMGATTVSQPAMDLTEKVYTEMTERLTDDYPKEKIDGFVAYVTNGGDWSEVSQLSPVGNMWLDTTTGENEGDELRGGASNDFLWIDEQMMCKTGVKTRNEAHDAGNRASRDDTERTVDQVVHEFAHSIDYRFELRSRIESLFPSDPSFPAAEAWAAAIQGEFGAPVGAWPSLTDEQEAMVDEVFGTESTSFKCF